MSVPVTSLPTDRQPTITPSVTAMLTVKNAAEAIEFYKRAFDAIELYRLTDPYGKIGHAELRIGSSLVMLADEWPGFNYSPESLGSSPVVMHLSVDNADTTVEQAIAAGARLLIPVSNQFYGDRSGRVQDPSGHIWLVSTRIENLTPCEMQQRFTALHG